MTATLITIFGVFATTASVMLMLNLFVQSTRRRERRNIRRLMRYLDGLPPARPW